MRIAGLLLVASVLGAETIGERIDKILADSPAAQQSFWGIHVVDLETGAMVYERNQDRFFFPASNTKLFSTALALPKLGPDHRFRTTITAPAKPDASGRVPGFVSWVAATPICPAASFLIIQRKTRQSPPLCRAVCAAARGLPV